jgi:hypothetical protein
VFAPTTNGSAEERNPYSLAARLEQAQFRADTHPRAGANSLRIMQASLSDISHSQSFMEIVDRPMTLSMGLVIAAFMHSAEALLSRKKRALETNQLSAHLREEYSNAL